MWLGHRIGRCDFLFWLHDTNKHDSSRKKKRGGRGLDKDTRLGWGELRLVGFF